MIKQIEALLGQNRRIRVAIDGRCCAGKSTLADRLATQYGGAVVRMDHFFLPPQLRREGRVNIHYERFEEEVAGALERGGAFSYRVFDCKTAEFTQSVAVPDARLVLIEGAYCMLPRFERLYDFKIFADVTEAEQTRRLIVRNGQKGCDLFKSRWIPLEEKYFEDYSVRQRCDYLFFSESRDAK